MTSSPRARAVPVALIGQKFMGRAHSNAYSQVPRFFDVPCTPVLHTIAARNAGELASFAERWGYAGHTTNWQDIANDDEVELVDIATPNFVHAEQSIAMLEAGKHVACEKPLAGNLDDARAMMQAAQKAEGQHTFVWYNYRRCPAVALAHQLIQEGRLGRIYHVRATYLQSWGGPDTELSWRFQKKLAGSGAHGDLNAHIIDMARFLTGDEIVEINGAISRNFIEERTVPGTSEKQKSDVDDAVLFLASFASGAVASFEATRLATGHHNRNTIEINGENGAIAFDFEDMNLLSFLDASDGPREGGWRRIMCTSAGNHPYAAAWWPDAHIIGYEHGFTNMAADIMRVLGDQEPEVPLPDFADAYETQRVLEAALLSAENRSAIPMSEVE